MNQTAGWKKFLLVLAGSLLLAKGRSAEAILSATADFTPPATTDSAAAKPADSAPALDRKPPIASVWKSAYGKTADGTVVDLYTFTNKNGAVAKVITYGATIINLEVPDRDGKLANVVLATATPEAFQRFSQSASVKGRVANRIAGAGFALDGQEYKLAANDGKNTLHGGKIGFDQVIWKAEIPTVANDAGYAVKFSYVSKDGEEGFPGTLTTTLTYRFTDDNVLRLEYTATTDKATPVNLTNHAYFNLGGGTGNVGAYEMTVNADRYTVADATNIPTGEIVPVTGTAVDFVKPTTLGANAAKLAPNRNFDHNFVLNRTTDAGKILTFAARVTDPATGRTVECWTNEPGLQLYTNALAPAPAAGARAGRGTGFFTLETQHFPDAVHHDNFPSIIVRPGETFKSTTEYRFSAK